MKVQYLLLLWLMTLNGAAWAQNCPNGIPSAGNPGCIPPDNVASPYYQNHPASQPSAPHWELTWGAIAADSTGTMGWTVGHFYKWAAKREALSRCRKMGGEDCKVMLAYEHQCAAIANPTENGKLIAGTIIYQNEATAELASERALSTCKVKRDGGECSIAYAECTVPVLMK